MNGKDCLSLAACDQCALGIQLRREGNFNPVPAEINNSETLVVMPFPAKRDELRKRPGTGQDGAEVLEALQQAGLSRRDVSWTTVVACRYPRDKKKEFDAKRKRMNRQRKRKGESLLLSPEECCRPRLEAELQQHSGVLACGSFPAKAILPGAPNLRDVRGAPIVLGDGTKVLATEDPSKVRFQPKWRHYFRKDIAKAVRHYRGSLDWVEPEVVIAPSAQKIREVCETWRDGRIVAYDWETTRDDTLLVSPTCLGIGRRDLALVIPWVSIESGRQEWYTLEEFEEVKEELRKFLTDPKIVKLGHNSGYFDRIVTENWLGVTPKPHLDMILAHRLHNNEMPHSLGFVGAEFTDAPAWKADHTATEARTDDELHQYNGRDCAITDICAPLVFRSMRSREQADVFRIDSKLQELCVNMKRLGVPLDDERRLEHLSQQEVLRDKWKKVLLEAAPDLNPASPEQMCELLFYKWHLPPQDFTAAGVPSTNDASLRALISSPVVDGSQREFLKAVRLWRRANKLITTYLLPLAEKARDGGVHADYSVHGTMSGRFSSSNPNFQNIPYLIRDIFTAPPGYRFVYADMDQLELRLAAAIAGADMYLKSFRGEIPIEPHGITGQAMFGDAYWKIEGAPKDRTKKGKGQFKAARDLAKTLCYASLYGASPTTIHKSLTSAEDANGNLIYAHYNVRKVSALHRRWKKGAPQFEAWWKDEVQRWRKKGYVLDPVLGRRCDFADGEDLSAIVNFPCQAGGFGVVALGLVDLGQRIKPNWEDRTGLVNQTHDSVLYLVKEEDAERTARIVEECLTRTVLGVEFSAEAEIQGRMG